MNLVEKLMKIDRGELNKKKTKEIPSRMLSEILGEDASVTIQSLNPQEVLELTMVGLDGNGDPILEKSLETNSLLVATALIDPQLKDAGLMEHLGVHTPAMAALKLFKGEVNKIAAEVNKMAGFDMKGDDSDKEIKN